MRNYETVCIVKPDVGDEVVKGIISRATAVVEGSGGSVVKLDEWGRKRLAFPIGKKNEGYYFVLTYKAAPEASKEIGRLLRLNEDVLRHQTVKLEEITQKAEEKPAAEAKAEGGQA